jgi:hypothetical protein
MSAVSRKFKRLGRLIETATEGARSEPVPRTTDLSFSLSDTVALGKMYRELQRGPRPWRTGETELARRLRAIADVLDSWQRLPDQLRAEYPDDSTRRFQLRAEIERNMLATIGWLYVGRAPDEVRRQSEG